MTDRARRELLAAQFDRLRTAILTSDDLAKLPEDSELRRVMAKTLERLREQIERDPAWFERVLHDAGVSLPPSSESNRSTES